MPTLSIIIVSYNTKDLTARAVESVLGAGEIIVVDNHSTDDSPAHLRSQFGSRIQIVERPDNGGFAVANNVGIHHARGEYLLLLNSDTIVHPGAIDAMLEAMRQHPEIGILSGRLLNEDGTYQPQGGALPTFVRIAAWWLWPLPGNVPGIAPYQYNQDVLRSSSEARRTQDDHARRVGWVGGTAMMIRRVVMEKIGYLDEKIFMYAEDVDYCLRARHAGFVIAITPRAEITHLGSRSTGSQNALFGEVRGLRYLWKKHFPRWQQPILTSILLVGAILRYGLFGILKGSVTEKRLYGRIIKELL